MFADGAGISLSLHVLASSEGERRVCGKPLIIYRYTEHSRSFEVYIFHSVYVYRNTTWIYVHIIACSLISIKEDIGWDYILDKKIIYEIRHNLICTSCINSFYVFRLNMKDLIRIEMQNIRTVHLLVLKVYIHKLTIHGMSNMTVDTNIFDK